MAYTPTILCPTTYPGTSGTTLYTVPAAKTTIVKNIILANTTGTEATVSLSVVPSGGSAATSNRVLSTYAVPANGISTLDCSLVMPTAAFLFGTNTTNNAVTMTISGVEVG
jgi:hypothetical protein